ncbi:MAG TPA: aminopeptidase [candidate division Zixibacteria bacterium]|nr:aminopeptidase [candidate division Zixibacteria bacterium]
MKDKRNEILARTLINYSTDLQPGEHIYIEMKGKEATELGKECIRQATEKGGIPFWFYNDESILRQFLQSATEEQFKEMAEFHLAMMKKSAAYLGIRGSDNPFDLADIPEERMAAYNRLFYRPVHLEQRVRFTKWCVMRFPNNAMAQLAQMPQEKFEEFYYDVCNVDYAKMSKAMDPLVKLMKQTEKVRLAGPGDTDLTFSIKDIGVVKCDGTRNIPDGEVYTAPVRESVNGVIQYNTPSLKDGTVYEDIRFEFKDGKIIKATCKSSEDKLNKVLDTDENARYIGEFSLGLNPMITMPMKDTLFDEKIGGSIHLTPGACYDEAPNGNKSDIHWDLIMIQTPEYGGGEIYFDDKLIRKDGKFTDASLEAGFTPENLKMEA